MISAYEHASHKDDLCKQVEQRMKSGEITEEQFQSELTKPRIKNKPPDRKTVKATVDMPHDAALSQENVSPPQKQSANDAPFVQKESNTEVHHHGPAIDDIPQLHSLMAPEAATMPELQMKIIANEYQKYKTGVNQSLFSVAASTTLNNNQMMRHPYFPYLYLSNPHGMTNYQHAPNTLLNSALAPTAAALGLNDNAVSLMQLAQGIKPATKGMIAGISTKQSEQEITIAADIPQQQPVESLLDKYVYNESLNALAATAEESSKQAQADNAHEQAHHSATSANKSPKSKALTGPTKKSSATARQSIKTSQSQKRSAKKRSTNNGIESITDIKKRKLDKTNDAIYNIEAGPTVGRSSKSGEDVTKPKGRPKADPQANRSPPWYPPEHPNSKSFPILNRLNINLMDRKSVLGQINAGNVLREIIQFKKSIGESALYEQFCDKFLLVSVPVVNKKSSFIKRAENDKWIETILRQSLVDKAKEEDDNTKDAIYCMMKYLVDRHEKVVFEALKDIKEEGWSESVNL